MRLILWIAIFVSTLAGASYGYYKFRESRMIAHPVYIEEFAQEARQSQGSADAAENTGATHPEDDAECKYLRQIDWSSIINNHTFLHGLERKEIKSDTVWTLRLSLLAFLGMEYDLFEIEKLDAQSLTYHRIHYSDASEAVVRSETQPFDHFRQQVCGIDRVRPLIYVASEMGQVALPLPEEFNQRFMNQAEFRQLLGQRINKPFRININQSNWTVEDFLDLMEQP
ncbi:MAG TPA: hypothetical protein VE954_19155 [Oligoflexus sp.]|uniref:hypothetical protein n=1 Tax=Oligoflexus sp. TaxID=1971216 RepID=UPI002D53A308|nr:hypothetical protein [Oligoflexus sp.]HYX35219.1 hypothetical protein [Oligoflexus sp.]